MRHSPNQAPSRANEPLGQCETCGGEYPESELQIESVPGAALAFCDDCSELPRHKQYGVRP